MSGLTSSAGRERQRVTEQRRREDIGSEADHRPSGARAINTVFGHNRTEKIGDDPMRAEIREFVIAQLAEMNYDVEGIDDETTLGPSGVDLESLALADLAVRVEDRFGVKFGDDESEALALMTVGEFTTTVADRVAQLDGASQ
jgi:acyl carrier protein